MTDPARDDPPPAPPADPTIDAHMDRIIEALYINTITLAKVGRIPPSELSRLLICAAAYGLENAIVRYQQDINAPNHAELHDAIREQIDSLVATLNEALTSLQQLVVLFTDTPPTQREA